MVDINRYARHISLPDVGLDGQRKINKSRILVVGAGGLGSPVLLYLAAAGVGKIGIIDDDIVELSNLQRQVIHSESKIGDSKSESAKQRIRSINSAIEVITWSERLTPDNARDIFSNWDLVIDGTDNIPTRYLVDDMCKILEIPWVYGSIYRFEGQVSVFNYQEGPCYRDLFPEPPPSNAIPSCAEGGVFGVLPGVIGAIQATEAIKMVLERGEVLSGKLLLYDGDLMNFKTLNFSKSEDTCPDLSQVRKMFEHNGWCVSNSLIDSEIHEPSMLGSAMFNHLSAKQYKEKKDNGWNPYLIDVRSAVEYGQLRISFTDLQVAHEEILSHVNEIPTDRDVILLCRSGMRSQMAAMFLINAGFDGQKLYNFDGGIMAWSSEIPADVQ